MKNTQLQFCNETVHPGERLSLALPLPEFFSSAPLYMPINIVHGKQAGPCLLVTAAMHGNELNGTEIINRLLNSSALKRLQGTLIAVPVMNIYGLMNRSRYLPGGIELDRSFPGMKNGTYASRIAHIFTKEVFSKADACIDLQTGSLNYSNLPQVYVTADDAKSKALAHDFGAPVISTMPREKGMLRTYAFKQEKPFLLYEAGEAMRFDEYAIKVGLKGILKAMRKLGMLPETTAKIPNTKKNNPKKTTPFFAEKNIWSRAPKSGISYTSHQLGQLVKKGERLCVIRDPFGATDDIYVNSPEEAVIVGKNNLPLVHEGEGLFQLAIFPKMGQAATGLEDWEENNMDSANNAMESSR